MKLPHFLRSLALLVLAAIVPAAAMAQNILLFESGGTNAKNALDGLGLSYTQSPTQTDFGTQLAGGPWSLVIFNQQSGPATSVTAALQAYITGGGKLLISYYDLDNDAALAAALGVSSSASTASPLDVTPWIGAHPIFNTPNAVTPLTEWADLGTDNGDKYNVTGADAVALAGFTASPTAGEAAIVMANSGRTLVNGWSFQDATTQNGINLIANEIRFLLDQPRILVHETGNQVRTSLNTEGIPFTFVNSSVTFMTTLASGTWDLAILDEFNTTLASSTNLVNYMNSGGKAIVNHYDLDEASQTALATELGVTVAQSIPGGEPSNPTYSWNPGHPIYSRPNPVSSPVSLNNLGGDWGDRFTVSGPDAIAVGGLVEAPTGGYALTVLSHANRVIANGFSFFNVNDQNGRNLLANQIHFLLDAPRILAFDDAYGANDTVYPALRATGHRFVSALDHADFASKVAQPGGWDLVVLHVQNQPFNSNSLIQYLNGGGRAVLSYWYLQSDPGLAAAAGVSAANPFNAPKPFYPWKRGHTIFTTPTLIDPVTTLQNYYDIDGQKLTPTGDGVVLAGFTPAAAANEGAIVLTNDRKVLVNGWAFFNSADDNARALVANEMKFFLDQPRILAFDDGQVFQPFGKTNLYDALARQGLRWVQAAGPDDFMTRLNNAAWWDLAAFSIQSNLPGTFTPLTNFIAGGGKAIGSLWALQSFPAVAGAFGVTDAGSFDTPLNVTPWNTNHPVFNTPNKITPLTSWADFGATNGSRLETTPGSIAIAGFTPSPDFNQSAIVMGNNANTIYNGFAILDINDANGINLVANEIDYLLTPPRILHYSCSGGDIALSVANDGLRSIQKTSRSEFLTEVARPGRWDLVLFNEQCSPFSSTSTIVDYINGGGRVIGSYYFLDGDPALATALGITATVSFNAPLDVTFYQPAHPIFTTPNIVGPLQNWIDTGLDNGDQLATSPGVQVLAGFGPSSTGTNGAIVVGNGGKTIYHGFSFDDINDGDGRALLQNEIRSLMKTSRREFGDFDDSGCTDISDFLFLLDYWNATSPIGGDPISIIDFLALLDNWNSGPSCP